MPFITKGKFEITRLLLFIIAMILLLVCLRDFLILNQYDIDWKNYILTIIINFTVVLVILTSFIWKQENFDNNDGLTNLLSDMVMIIVAMTNEKIPNNLF